MSGLAILLSEMGAQVSGSDLRDSPVLQELSERGVVTFVGHRASNAADAEVLLWSPAVTSDNVEVVAAREAGAEMVPRARALFEIASLKRVVGLTGTHGKTTATSMMVQVSLAAGRDDGWLLGAPVLGIGANGHWGGGDVIVEVDESYGTFGELTPFALGLLNVEADHLDHYGSLDALEEAFGDLVVRTLGPVVAWGDDAGVARVVARSKRDVLLVGTTDAHPWRVTDVNLERRRASFDLRGPDGEMKIDLRVTGAHNVANAAVVATLAHALGIESSAIVAGLSNFLGAPRRYQFRGAWRGVDVYEDYAHLPGEIAATIEATHAANYDSVTAVFQPHRFTRTRSLAEEFGAAFLGARHVVVTDVYGAGEENPWGVSGVLIVNALGRRDPSLDVHYVPALEDVTELLEELVTTSDVILFLGAGDVGSLIAMLPGGLR
jgi:UDP-N-acetylmuramate--alanine ligase